MASTGIFSARFGAGVRGKKQVPRLMARCARMARDDPEWNLGERVATAVAVNISEQSRRNAHCALGIWEKALTRSGI
jgi:hypothetical protein